MVLAAPLFAFRISRGPVAALTAATYDEHEAARAKSYAYGEAALEEEERVVYDPDRHGSRFMLTGRAEPAAPRAEASAHREPGGRRVSTAIGHRLVDAGGAAAGRPTVMKRASTGQWENQAVPQWGTSSHNPRVQVQGEPSRRRL